MGVLLGECGVLVRGFRARASWRDGGPYRARGVYDAPPSAPAAAHGMPVTTGARLLALIGLFDVAGTIASGWFTDRFDSRVLLTTYYALRGLSLFLLPQLFAGSLKPPILAFVIFYGLDWVATVPPTVALCRRHFGADAPIVFGWVLACHQVGAALAVSAAGLARDHFGNYDLAWYAVGSLCLVAVLLCLALRRRPAVVVMGD
ncbi:putative MFS family arabinose efflux permease [Kitasatospora sp. GP82]|nr:putative MFS family arabinose efflux permease [Kitasatospora sp. GP82]